MSPFAFTAYRRLHRGPGLLMRRGRRLEGCGVACARSPYVVAAPGLAVVSAWCGLTFRRCLGHRDLLQLCGDHRRHHRSPTSAKQPAGQDPEAQASARN